MLECRQNKAFNTVQNRVLLCVRVSVSWSSAALAARLSRYREKLIRSVSETTRCPANECMQRQEEAHVTYNAFGSRGSACVRAADPVHRRSSDREAQNFVDRSGLVED